MCIFVCFDTAFYSLREASLLIKKYSTAQKKLFKKKLRHTNSIRKNRDTFHWIKANLVNVCADSIRYFRRVEKNSHGFDFSLPFEKGLKASKKFCRICFLDECKTSLCALAVFDADTTKVVEALSAQNITKGCT